jgi:uncharacterized repeat protein (TIGR01451 family)
MLVAVLLEAGAPKSSKGAKGEVTMHDGLFKVRRPSILALGTVLLLAASSRAATPTDMTLKVTGTSFRVGGLGRYTLTVANRGKQPTDGPVDVRATLPDGLTLASQRGSDWTCSATGQVVDCVTSRPIGVGRVRTLRLSVNVCTTGVASVVTSFRVVYAADTNPGNNTATRSTGIRAGQCAGAAATPTQSSGTPAATRTPAPGVTRTPTPSPMPNGENPAAPVITSFTCEGGAACTVSAGQSFALQFSFTDANGNAINWSILARRDDGFTKQVGRGSLGAGTAGTTISLQHPGFTCSFSHCRQDVWDFALTVTDTTGLTSVPISVTITVLGS